MKAAARTALAVVITFMPIVAGAQTIGDTEAGKIQDQLTQYLPEAARKAGFVRVVPSGDHYELRLDLAAVLKEGIAPWTVGEITPLVHNLTPRADGLWDIAGTGGFKLATELAAANRSSAFQVTIGAIDSKGVFDPSIKFLRDGDIKLQDIAATLRSGQDSIKFGLKEYAVKTSVMDRAPGIGDFNTKYNARDFSETFGTFPNPEVRVSAKVLEGHQEFENVDFAGIAKLIAFWQGTASGKKIATLTDAQRTELSAIIVQHKPFMAKASEHTDLRDISIDSAGKSFSIEKWAYSWGLEDIANDGAFVLGTVLENPSVAPGVWPAGLEKALPKQASVNFRYTGFKPSAMWAALSDPKSTAALAEQGGDYYTKLMLPTGRMKVEFTDTYVRSEHYDINVTGSMFISPGKANDQSEADLVITARDFDKTVKFLQEGAKTVPLFGQASFGALMAKGLGKAQADGSMVWNVKIDPAGKIMVNGQQLQL